MSASNVSDFFLFVGRGGGEDAPNSVDPTEVSILYSTCHFETHPFLFSKLEWVHSRVQAYLQLTKKKEKGTHALSPKN